MTTILVYVTIGLIAGFFTGLVESFIVDDKKQAKIAILASLFGYGGGLALVDSVLLVALVLFPVPAIYLTYMLSFNLFMAFFWLTSSLTLALLS